MKELPEVFFLIGYMGSGKSTVGKILSRQLQYEYVDMDARIEQTEGKDIRSIFEDHGEAYFRVKEAELLELLCSKKRIVVSCGGGVVKNEKNVRLLRENGTTVFLKANIATLFERVKDDKKRPLVMPREEGEKSKGKMARFAGFREIYRQREENYIQSCDFYIDTDGYTPQEIAQFILSKSKGVKDNNEICR